jgi:hypothetical protein
MKLFKEVLAMVMIVFIVSVLALGMIQSVISHVAQETTKEIIK